jgi:hypothetical protein
LEQLINQPEQSGRFRHLQSLVIKYRRSLAECSTRPAATIETGLN